MFGHKRIIAQYEARIADLKAQIEDLRSLAIPQSRPGSIPLSLLEADAVLSSKEEIYHLTDAEKKDLEESISERDRILSGNYS